MLGYYSLAHPWIVHGLSFIYPSGYPLNIQVLAAVRGGMFSMVHADVMDGMPTLSPRCSCSHDVDSKSGDNPWPIHGSVRGYLGFIHANMIAHDLGASVIS